MALLYHCNKNGLPESVRARWYHFVYKQTRTDFHQETQAALKYHKQRE